MPTTPILIMHICLTTIEHSNPFSHHSFTHHIFPPQEPETTPYLRCLSRLGASTAANPINHKKKRLALYPKTADPQIWYPQPKDPKGTIHSPKTHYICFQESHGGSVEIGTGSRLACSSLYCFYCVLRLWILVS
ncbi:hypothetical protein J6590_002549 [Homalodisca vitripennis]|nr:hypothetical protein J6590_002549 [Homalodisca vitripennis]